MAIILKPRGRQPLDRVHVQVPGSFGSGLRDFDPLRLPLGDYLVGLWHQSVKTLSQSEPSVVQKAESGWAPLLYTTSTVSVFIPHKHSRNSRLAGVK